MTFSIPNKILSFLSISYFFFAGVETIAELFEYQPLLFGLRFFAPIILLMLYVLKSPKKNPLFIAIIVLHLLCNILFFYVGTLLFIYAVLGFIIMRILSLILVLRLTRRKNFLYFTIATFPFLLIFFYLISITSEIPDYELNVLIIQSVLISLLGGISVVNYFKSDNIQNSWLLISTLLYMGLRFLVFIERYFLPESELKIYRPIGVILTTFALYSFYKYVLASESYKEN